jgi:hypothetical protein
MGEGFTSDLLWIWGWTTGLCALMAMRRLAWPIAILIAVVRTSIPLFYFAIWFDGSWILLDDVTYCLHGADLMDLGFNPLSSIATPDGIDTLCALSGGTHILYSWWNLVAQYLFGEHYYAAVFMNVGLSFLASHVFSKMLEVIGFNDRYQRFAQIFLLVHWDIVAWSSFVNLKDVVVFTLTTVALYCCIGYFRYRMRRYMIGFAGTCFLFYWIRFYVPLLMLGAVAIWVFTQWQDHRKYLLGLLMVLGICACFQMISQQLDWLDPTNLIYGSFRFALTPMPWSISPEYTFLYWPSILHWVMVLPLVAGAVMLWRTSPLARLLVIYLVEMVVLYGVTEELQGPRHRFQIALVLIWAQFHFLWQLRPQRSTAVAIPLTVRPLVRRLAA